MCHAERDSRPVCWSCYLRRSVREPLHFALARSVAVHPVGDLRQAHVQPLGCLAAHAAILVLMQFDPDKHDVEHEVTVSGRTVQIVYLDAEAVRPEPAAPPAQAEALFDASGYERAVEPSPDAQPGWYV